MAKYNIGMKIGPKEVLFIEELDPYISPSGNKKRRGKFICPNCEKVFEARLDRILSKDFTSCSQCSRKLTNSENLVGKKFGNLTVIEPTDKRSGNCIIWKCKCDCGNYAYPNTHSLKIGKTKSCGCLQRELARKRLSIELTGEQFGKLTVLEKYKTDPNKGNIWKCQCECGNICYVNTGNLTSGRIKSCGCLKSKGELLLQQILNENKISYEKEKQFKDCVNSQTGYPLRFDFYLPDYNCCIEYDGKQHFICDSSGWNTEKNFKKTQDRDNIKNQYCLDHHIKLIRISYKDYHLINWSYLKGKINDV